MTDEKRFQVAEIFDWDYRNNQDIIDAIKKDNDTVGVVITLVDKVSKETALVMCADLVYIKNASENVKRKFALLVKGTTNIEFYSLELNPKKWHITNLQEKS